MFLGVFVQFDTGENGKSQCARLVLTLATTHSEVLCRRTSYNSTPAATDTFKDGK